MKNVMISVFVLIGTSLAQAQSYTIPTMTPAPNPCITTYDCAVSATACKDSGQTGNPSTRAIGFIVYATTTRCSDGRSGRSEYTAVVNDTDVLSCIALENQYLSKTPACQ